LLPCCDIWSAVKSSERSGASSAFSTPPSTASCKAGFPSAVQSQLIAFTSPPCGGLLRGAAALGPLGSQCKSRAKGMRGEWPQRPCKNFRTGRRRSVRWARRGLAHPSRDDARGWRSALARLAAAALAAALQVLLDPVGLVAHRLDRLLELVRGDAELLRPVAQLVVFVHVDALAVRSAALFQVVRHGGLRGWGSPGAGKPHACR